MTRGVPIGPREYNLAEVHEAMAEAIGTREAIVSSSGRMTWSQLSERTRRLANFLVARGLTVHKERSELGGSEVGQDRVAILLHNRPEYIESMLGSFKARLAPCNVNYRYVATEVADLFDDMRPAAVIYETRFASILESAVAKMPSAPVLLEVGTGQHRVSFPDAVAYEDALAGSSSGRPSVSPSLDDLYILYTGGTTGKPKGVLWRQADIFAAALGGRNFRENGREWESLEELLMSVAQRRGTRALSAAPFMHGIGQWVAFQALHTGGAIVIPSVIETFDANDVLDTVSKEEVSLLAIAGESFAKPLLDAMKSTTRDLSSLRLLISSGAALTSHSKKHLIEQIDGLRIQDTVGSSEAGLMAQNVTATGNDQQSPRFTAGNDTFVLDETRTQMLAPGHAGNGWLARGGRLPLGYFNDPERSEETFPEIDGVRVCVPGDRARIDPNGTIEILGRDSVTINSGGEKIFAEEIEAVIQHHPGVRDVIVVGRSSKRWGNEVVALIEPIPDGSIHTDEIYALCHQNLARYKAPKEIIFVDHVGRTAAGKPDYVWAIGIAEGQRAAGR